MANTSGSDARLLWLLGRDITRFFDSSVDMPKPSFPLDGDPHTWAALCKDYRSSKRVRGDTRFSARDESVLFLRGLMTLPRFSQVSQSILFNAGRVPFEPIEDELPPGDRTIPEQFRIDTLVYELTAKPGGDIALDVDRDIGRGRGRINRAAAETDSSPPMSHQAPPHSSSHMPTDEWPDPEFHAQVQRLSMDVDHLPGFIVLINALQRDGRGRTRDDTSRHDRRSVRFSDDDRRDDRRSFDRRGPRAGSDRRGHPASARRGPPGALGRGRVRREFQFTTCGACGRAGHEAVQCDFLAMWVYVQRNIKQLGADVVEKAYDNWRKKNEDILANARSRTPAHAATAMKTLMGIDDDETFCTLCEDELDWPSFYDGHQSE